MSLLLILPFDLLKLNSIKSVGCIDTEILNVDAHNQKQSMLNRQLSFASIFNMNFVLVLLIFYQTELKMLQCDDPNSQIHTF